MTEFILCRVRDFAALGQRWRELEARSDCSFFQSWTWMGCLAERRFDNPVLLEARQAGETVAMALFNRRRWPRDSLFLGESGSKVLDTPYVEHNGPLVARGAESVVPGLLDAARRGAAGRWRPILPRRIVLSGVGDSVLAAACGVGSVILKRSNAAPFVDLDRVLSEGGDYLDGVSSNTRYQLRRSERAYAADGKLELRRAADVYEAHRLLDEMAVLHQRTWQARGQAGAFAVPFFTEFHRAVIARGLPRGEIDLLQLAAGGRVIGILYNFRYAGRALAYQSGFNYADADRHCKPGLTTHHQAIRFYLREGIHSYDFLGGEDRYKRSLAREEAQLHWLEVGTARSLLARWKERAHTKRLKE
ncbi:MAG: GNAT family N-acetyltransferase [Acetobacteraceae bacterium]|nr:GNAT family N-acetyltransferase [Acetobacteraceae bacterium]